MNIYVKTYLDSLGDHGIAAMALLLLVLLGSCELTKPAHADPAADEVTVELSPKLRAEIYLARSKARTAAKADKITGRDTFRHEHAKRKLAEPKRYVPRAITLRKKEKPDASRRK